MEIADYLTPFLVISVFGLILSLCTEQSQIIAKIRGANLGKIATGYNSAMKIMIVNRMGTILYMFFLALAIDIGISNRSVLFVALISCCGVIAYNIFLIIFRSRLLLVSQESTGDESLLRSLTAGGIKYSIASYTATLLNVLGLTLPLVLSNSIPEYRLSMANTGFLLNTFFTLINVLLLESQIARTLDSGSKHDAYLFTTKIFVTRALAVATAMAVFGYMIFYLT